MEYHPKKHQQLSAEFIQSHDRCALFLDMGLGKTVITLTEIHRWIYEDFSVDKVLVIAPLRVAEDTWTREASKWDHLSDLRVAKVLGTQKQRVAALASSADVYVINRENTQWLVENYGDKWPFDAVVIDESSSFKNSQSKRWRMLKRVIGMSTKVLLLTGSPAPNSYMDLWAQIYLIDKGATLGKTLGAFRNTYFIAGAHKGYVVYDWRLKHGAKDAIDKKIKPFCLSMSKEDWLDLPPIIFNDIRVTMSREERKIYDKMVDEKILPLLDGKIADVDGDIDSAVIGETAAVLSGKLLQMSNGAVYDNEGDAYHVHDRKLDALEEIVDTANGQSLLVFYSYKHDKDRILERFPNAVTLKDSDDISRWNSGKEQMMLLCHPASAAFGLNLQEGGHIIVWFGLPWSLELYQQANARLYRQGQEQGVIVNHIICNDTYDDKVLKALSGKDASQKSLLNALKEYVKEKQ